jgi:hypothetical protein
MLIDKSSTWDRVFVALLAVAVAGTLVGLRMYANHLSAKKAEQAASSAQEPKRVLHLEAITNVYECERDGRRVLTDRPCGTGVPIRVLSDEDRRVPNQIEVREAGKNDDRPPRSE